MRKLFFASIVIILWSTSLVLVLMFSDFSPTVLSFKHQSGGIEQSTQLKNNKWNGEFLAKENYLGIVTVTFVEKSAPIRGLIVFRVRESGESSWLAENTYDSRQFYLLSEYPLGFPVIPDSKDKKYEFEFEASTTLLANQFTTSQLANPVVISKYKFPKQELFTQPKTLITFIIKKIAYTTTDFELIIKIAGLSLMYIFALWFYLGNLRRYVTSIKRMLIKHFPLHASSFLLIYKNPLSIFVFGMLFSDIFLISGYYTLFSVLIVLIWLYLIFKFKISINLTFVLVSVLVIFLMLTLLFSFENISEKLATWIYYFLCISCLHALIKIYLLKR